MYGGWRSNHLSSEGKNKGRLYMGWRREMNEYKKKNNFDWEAWRYRNKGFAKPNPRLDLSKE